MRLTRKIAFVLNNDDWFMYNTIQYAVWSNLWQKVLTLASNKTPMRGIMLLAKRVIAAYRFICYTQHLHLLVLLKFSL